MSKRETDRQDGREMRERGDVASQFKVGVHLLKLLFNINMTSWYVRTKYLSLIALENERFTGTTKTV